jgi:hypothetical protein
MLSNSRDRGSRFDEQNIGIASRCWIKKSVVDVYGKHLDWLADCLMALAKNKAEPHL